MKCSETEHTHIEKLGPASPSRPFLSFLPPGTVTFLTSNTTDELCLFLNFI